MRPMTFERQLQRHAHTFGLRLTHVHGVNTPAKLQEAKDMISECDEAMHENGERVCTNLCGECQMFVTVVRVREKAG